MLRQFVQNSPVAGDINFLPLLDEAGYKSVEDVAREDEDKLAQKAGIGGVKAKAVKASAAQFLAGEWKTIDEARKRVVANAEQPKA